ncbi:MAG: DUF4124 domain-containing protein [Pseudomonadota bacterium]|nr:DUF4124 domain-containing protein [Pseudomonadota bacterium]
MVVLSRRLSYSLLTICLAGGVLSTPAAASQTFFKCTNASGVTQYAQRPVASQKCTLVRVDGKPPSAVDHRRVEDQRNLSRAMQNKPQQPTTVKKTTDVAPNQTETTPPPNAADKEQCAQLSQARATLERGGRVYETDDKGERNYLSDEQRSARLQEYQQLSKTRCAQ